MSLRAPAVLVATTRKLGCPESTASTSEKVPSLTSPSTTAGRSPPRITPSTMILSAAASAIRRIVESAVPSAAACGRTAGSRYSGSSSGVASFDFRWVTKTSIAGTSGARACPTVTCSTERENSSIATRTPSSSWLGTNAGSRSGSIARVRRRRRRADLRHRLLALDEPHRLRERLVPLDRPDLPRRPHRAGHRHPVPGALGDEGEAIARIDARRVASTASSASRDQTSWKAITSASSRPIISAAHRVFAANSSSE